MPEFRTFVMRGRPSTAPSSLRTGLCLAALGVITAASGLDGWTHLASDATTFLRALPWLVASWL